MKATRTVFGRRNMWRQERENGKNNEITSWPSLMYTNFGHPSIPNIENSQRNYRNIAARLEVVILCKYHELKYKMRDIEKETLLNTFTQCGW